MKTKTKDKELTVYVSKDQSSADRCPNCGEWLYVGMRLAMTDGDLFCSENCAQGFKGANGLRTVVYKIIPSVY